MIYLKPVLPGICAQVETFLKITPLQWRDVTTVLTSQTINIFTPLLMRVDPAKIAAMVDASKDNLTLTTTDVVVNSPMTSTPLAAEIEFAEFAKVDMRIALITNAEHVEGADKLLRITLDLGLDQHGQPITRNVFSGIKSAYKPEQLIGQYTVVVANLKARKMKFGWSEGMILAAGDGNEIYLLTAHAGAKPGTRVT
jgi:methionyl-tRNA synthetase